MTQYEEVQLMRDYGYTVEQIAILTGVEENKIREMIKSDVRIC